MDQWQSLLTASMSVKQGNEVGCFTFTSSCASVCYEFCMAFVKPAFSYREPVFSLPHSAASLASTCDTMPVLLLLCSCSFIASIVSSPSSAQIPVHTRHCLCLSLASSPFVWSLLVYLSLLLFFFFSLLSVHRSKFLSPLRHQLLLTIPHHTYNHLSEKSNSKERSFCSFFLLHLLCFSLSSLTLSSLFSLFSFLSCLQVKVPIAPAASTDSDHTTPSPLARPSVSILIPDGANPNPNISSTNPSQPPSTCPLEPASTTGRRSTLIASIKRVQRLAGILKGFKQTHRYV